MVRVRNTLVSIRRKKSNAHALLLVIIFLASLILTMVGLWGGGFTFPPFCLINGHNLHFAHNKSRILGQS
jgi:hypothetical protein